MFNRLNERFCNRENVSNLQVCSFQLAVTAAGLVHSAALMCDLDGNQDDGGDFRKVLLDFPCSHQWLASELLFLKNFKFHVQSVYKLTYCAA